MIEDLASRGSDPDRDPLGSNAVRRGFLTAGELAMCLEIQRMAARPKGLGEILLDLGHLDAKELHELVALEEETREEVDVQRGRRASEILFGEIAVAAGYCKVEQVHEGLSELDRRRGEGEDLRLGRILIDRGYLSPYQMQAVLARQGKRVLSCSSCAKRFNVLGHEEGLHLACNDCGAPLVRPEEEFPVRADEEVRVERAPAGPPERPGVRLGRLAIELGLATRRMVAGVLREQRRRAAGGVKRKIGEILVEERYLTRLQVVELLERQGVRIGRCGGCALYYNLLEGADHVHCPRCWSAVVAYETPGAVESLEVAGKIRRAPRLKLLDLDKRASAPAGPDAASARLRRFRADEGLADAEAPAAPTREARAPLAARPGRRGARRFWLLPLGGGVLVAAISGAIVGAYRLTRPPASGPASPAGPVEEAPVPLEEGERVEAYGVIPAGRPDGVALVEESVQAFLFESAGGRWFWAVDAAGGSADRLGFLEVSNARGGEHPVWLRAVHTREAPAAVAFPPAEVDGYLSVEEWRVLPRDPGRIDGPRFGLRILGPGE
ncbi:MAG: hypothetical protein HY720_22975 [Planctomycetes bacterium]|nr:hypothetical protein [Planctomycetota bacterium]